MIGKQGLLLAAMTALVGGCDDGRPAETSARPATTPISVGNPFHDGLVKLDELQRGAALRRAIRTSKESCDRVVSSSFQQDHGNLKMWVAACQRGAYAVFLAPNGDVQVRNCTDLASLKLPLCKLPAPAAKS
jgi:hypothetical protein